MKATRVRLFPSGVDIRGKSVFCEILHSALQNEDILGSNNRIETCDTAMKSVDDEFLKKKYLATIRIFYQSRKYLKFHLWV